MIKEKSCGCVVFNKDNEVLLVHMNAGHWSFPKGHVENNETEIDTALREVFEETNINCEIIDGFREVTTYSPYKGSIKDVVFFVAKSKNTTVKRQVEEIQSTGFYSLKDAKDLLTFESDKKVFEKAMLFWQKNN